MAQELAQQTQQEILRAERYARMPANQRERVLTLQNATLDRLYQRRGLTLDPGEMEAIDVLIERAGNEINAIQSAPPAPETPGQPTQRVSQEEVDKANAHLQQELNDLTDLAKKPIEELSGEQISEEAKLEAIKRKLEGPLSTAEKAVTESQKRDSEARVKAIQDLKAKKAPTEEAARQKEEAATLEAKAKQTAEDLAKLRREASTPADLQTSLNTDRTEASSLRQQLTDIDTELNNPATAAERKQELQAQKATLATREVEARNRIRLDEEALKVAQEKARVESGIGDVMSRENIRKMSVGDYLKLSTEERAKYLSEVAEVVNADRGRLDGIRQRMERGEPVSIEERALFTKDVSGALIEHGRGGYSMRNLRRIAANYPEVYKAITDKVFADKTVNAAIRKEFPTSFERMIDFAKSHPGWLMILLAIVAGTATVATAGLGTIAGVGVAGAGATAGATGVSRRNWG